MTTAIQTPLPAHCMPLRFEIPQGACNVESFIEGQQILTVESWEREGETLVVHPHFPELITQKVADSFQAAVDEEYLVERPGEQTWTHVI